MSDSQASGVEKKQDKRFLAVLILGVIVIAALLGVIIVLLLGRGNPTTTEVVREVVVRESAEPERRAVVINEDNIEEAAKEILNNPPTPLGYYEVSMNFTWNFPDGSSPSSDAYVENVPSNTSDVYFDVVLEADESVTLYASPILPPGTHNNEVKLTQDLDAGTYPCIIIYHLVDDQQRTTGTLRMNMDIIVEN
jgi:flagellar basal body-associated protein FliL